MPDKPLIVFPTPSVAFRNKLTGFPPPPHLPSRKRQGERLAPKFQTLKVYLEQKAIELRASAAGQIPEEVIVFQTVGSVADFLRAARKIAGLDLLAESEVEDMVPDDDFYLEKNADKKMSGRVFMVMTNQQALEQLLKLWESYQANRRVGFGFAPFVNLFKQLKDVRRWSVKDRLLETGIIKYWEEISQMGIDADVPFEIELWFRESDKDRANSIDRIQQIITHRNGQVVSTCEIGAICYHAVIVKLPAVEIRNILQDQNSDLLGESSIMCFRPTGQTVMPVNAPHDLQPPVVPLAQTIPDGGPTVALFDGLPLENHARLAGRLTVDDPDGYAAQYTVNEREHGTTMASIILHGDLNSPGTPLRRPLYVRPIMRPDPQQWDASRSERIPFGVNALDLTHRAVVKMFEESDGNEPVAPNVKIINFSIGDPTQQFNNSVSAWGRLLDWLSVKYNVLFCVSAGNHSTPIELDVDRVAFEGLPAPQKESALSKAILRDLRLRRILSPSDSINSITIGSAHHDVGPIFNSPNRFDPYGAKLMPSPLNGLGCGFRNSTKPDILLPGGRQFYSQRLGNAHPKAILEVARATVAPGILAASTSGVAGQTNHEKHSRGTSNATAFASRSAGFLYDQIVALRNEQGGEALTDDFSAVLLKAMLVHKANWGETHEYMKTLLGLDEGGGKIRRLMARFLGFGFVHPFESLLGADHRATMIGCGRLADGQAHEYKLPLPQGLNGVRGLRRIVVTLAWLSPIHPKMRNYRRAALWFDVENKKLATERRDSEHHSVRNGTVQHEVFEGERAAAYRENETILIKVNCRADAGTLEGSVRYGLVVSLEVAEELRIPVYEQVSVKVRQAVPA